MASYIHVHVDVALTLRLAQMGISANHSHTYN